MYNDLNTKERVKLIVIFYEILKLEFEILMRAFPTIESLKRAREQRLINYYALFMAYFPCFIIVKEVNNLTGVFCNVTTTSPFLHTPCSSSGCAARHPSRRRARAAVSSGASLRSPRRRVTYHG